MNIPYSKFQELNKKYSYEYMEKGLPYGGIRVFSKDDFGTEHSIVLTRDEFKKEFNQNTYMNLTSNSNSTGLLRTSPGKVWFTYENYKKLS